MSDPGLGVEFTQVPSDILLRILGATEEIRDLLRQKSDHEKKTAQEPSESAYNSANLPELEGPSIQGPFDTDVAGTKTDDQNEAGDTTQGLLNNDSARAEIEAASENDWPNENTIFRYRFRCAEHKSECEKMQVELGCFIAHMGIFGDNRHLVSTAELLRNGLLDPVLSLEKAFDVTPDGRPEAIDKVVESFDKLDDLLRDFERSSHQKDALYPIKVKQWRDINFDACIQSREYGLEINPVIFLKSIHDRLFFDLEQAMDAVGEALTAFEEKSVHEWLATQKIDALEKQCLEYIIRAFPSEVSGTTATIYLEEKKILRFGKHLATHRKSCIQMQEELDHLIEHYRIIGGDSAVITASQKLQKRITEPVDHLEQALAVREFGRQTIITSFTNLHFSVNEFQESLYHQKHAFYFRKVRKWVACIRDGIPRLLATSHRPDRFLEYICDELLLDLNSTMIGMSRAVEESKASKDEHAQVDVGNVAEELKTFGKESLPKFLVDQMERDTTRYVNLTTIATFFSSVTATTLQFTYAETEAVPSNSLRGVVNLFWFLSLVFSVSSGVSSLLGLTWRKSSIYDTRIPPRIIRMWFDKAPLLFLIIAAVSFVLGLNLFAYLSLQPHFVSFATSILTGLHGTCLLAATIWFLYQLKYESGWAGWIRTAKTIADWTILKTTKWMRKSVKCICKNVKRPYDKYKQNLHVQRNIFWAFALDNRVMHLNNSPELQSDSLGPTFLSKLVRLITYPIKKGWLATKKAVSILVHSVRKHMLASSPTGPEESDLELGERGGREESVAQTGSSPEGPAEKAKIKYRISLQKVFSEADIVGEIMFAVKLMENKIIDNDQDIKQFFKKWLWGYQDLVSKLYEEVRPAMVEQRERRMIEEQQQREKAIELADNNPVHVDREVTGQDKDNTVSTPTAPPTVIQLTPLDNISEHLGSTQKEITRYSPGQADDLPPSLDVHPTSTACQDAVEPGHLPTDSSSLSVAPVMGIGATALNEIEEATPTSENKKEEEPVE